MSNTSTQCVIAQKIYDVRYTILHLFFDQSDNLVKTCENKNFLENMIASTFKNQFHHSNHVLDKLIRLKLNLILKERHYFLIMMYGTSDI